MFDLCACCEGRFRGHGNGESFWTARCRSIHCNKRGNDSPTARIHDLCTSSIAFRVMGFRDVSGQACAPMLVALVIGGVTSFLKMCPLAPERVFRVRDLIGVTE